MSETLSILKGARERLQNGFNARTCHCETHVFRTPWPDRECGPWCPFCAIEAEQVTLRTHANLYQHCLSEIAQDVAGRPFATEQWAPRDKQVLNLMDDGAEAVLTAFDRTISRLESAASQ